MRVSEIRVKRIRVNQGLGVVDIFVLTLSSTGQGTFTCMSLPISDFDN